MTHYSAVVRQIISLAPSTGVMEIEQTKGTPPSYKVSLRNFDFMTEFYVSKPLTEEELQQVVGHYKKKMLHKFTSKDGIEPVRQRYTCLKLKKQGKDNLQICGLLANSRLWVRGDEWEHEVL